jgi:integrase/recombinase XerC
MTPAADDYLQRFARHLATERRLSPHTCSAYAQDLQALQQWCDQQQLADWTQLNTQLLRSFAARSHAGGLAPRSVQRRLSAVRSFYKFLLREGVISQLPTADVRAPKVGKRLPKVLDTDQMGRLLELKPDSTLDARDLAMMELFYSSGLRLAELVGLDLDQLDLADRTVRVLGKGRKTRIVPVGSKAIEALRDWLIERGTLARPDTRAVFVGRTGKRLGARAVQLRWTVQLLQRSEQLQAPSPRPNLNLCWPPPVLLIVQFNDGDRRRCLRQAHTAKLGALFDHEVDTKPGCIADADAAAEEQVAQHAAPRLLAVG